MSAIAVGKNYLREVAQIFGLQGHHITNAVISIDVRGAVVVNFTHIARKAEMDELNEVLRRASNDSEIRHNFSVMPSV